MGNPFNQAKAIFLAAIEEHTPEQWPEFVEQACAGDVRLRAQVEKLLRAQAEMGSFHEAARSALVATIDDPISERPGTSIGPYKLLEQIGEGGFGVVFMAEQTQPIRRKVALKVLKPGMDTRQVVIRFEAERQALAIMDHPHIAHVFDGGETAAGRPYFVMETARNTCAAGNGISSSGSASGIRPRSGTPLRLSAWPSARTADSSPRSAWMGRSKSGIL